MLAQQIGKYLTRIETEEGIKLQSNSLYNKVNEAIESMLKIKVTSLSQNQETVEDEETLTHQLFWDEASKCLEEIEKTMKAREVYESVIDQENVGGLSFNIGMQGNSSDAQVNETTTPLAGVCQLAQKKTVTQVLDIPSFDLGIPGVSPEYHGVDITMPSAGPKKVSMQYKRKHKDLKEKKDADVSKNTTENKDCDQNVMLVSEGIQKDIEEIIQGIEVLLMNINICASIFL